MFERRWSWNNMGSRSKSLEKFQGKNSLLLKLSLVILSRFPRLWVLLLIQQLVYRMMTKDLEFRNGEMRQVTIKQLIWDVGAGCFSSSYICFDSFSNHYLSTHIMAERASVNPKLLKWARRTAKYSKEDAASKVPVKVEKLKEWEAGVSLPTIRQAKILAKAYRRPFALFFLPDIPMDFQPLQDFRRHGSKPLTSASVFIIREIQQKQSWISSENQESGMEPLPFVGRYLSTDQASTIATDILDTLSINPLNYVTDNPIKEWIDKAEINGIFVSRTSFVHSYLRLDKEEIQGFAIADPYAPFVFINSDDWNAPQLFSLVHELAHIWISRTGISNYVVPEIVDRRRYHPIELLCNEIAANALIPSDYITNLDSSIYKSSKVIFKVARNLGVSVFAFLVRAKNLNLINNNQYYSLKTEAESAFKEFVAREELKKAKQQLREGGPSYYRLRINRNSRLFTQIVLDAFKGGRIEPSHASLLLNVKSNHFSKLEARMYS